MKDIPSDILAQFRNMLKKRLIPVGLHSYYLKWLQYYPDYCSMCHLPDNPISSLLRYAILARIPLTGAGNSLGLTV